MGGYGNTYSPIFIYYIYVKVYHFVNYIVSNYMLKFTIIYPIRIGNNIQKINLNNFKIPIAIHINLWYTKNVVGNSRLTKILEDTKMTKYTNIVFMQNEEAEEAMEILEESGVTGLLNFLKQWDMGDCIEEESPNRPWGGSDTVVYSGEYVLTYNRRLGYCGLIKDMKVS